MTHTCVTCKKEWKCLTEATFGTCDLGNESECYNCAGMPQMEKIVIKKTKEASG